MTTVAKGGNLPVGAPAVRAVLSWSSGPDVDAAALLVGSSGTVGSDDDFVFYNQPQHPGGCVDHLGKQSHADDRGVTDAVRVDLAGLPAGVERVVLAASTSAGTFGQSADLRLDLVDADADTPIAQFVLDAGDETALVTGELYRRDGGWKFRAVGQGYASGLAGLARDFGISVDDDDPPKEAELLAPLPPYDGPRPIVGQAYAPAPDGFAPPPPGR